MPREYGRVRFGTPLKIDKITSMAIHHDLVSLLAAADFLEQNQMQQCEGLRNAVKILEFVMAGGFIEVRQEAETTQSDQTQLLCLRKDEARYEDKTSPQQLSLRRIAMIIGQLEGMNRDLAIMARCGVPPFRQPPPRPSTTF